MMWKEDFNAILKDLSETFYRRRSNCENFML